MHLSCSPSARLRELSETLTSYENELHVFFEMSPDLLAIVQIDGFCKHVNQVWTKILGWSLNDLLEHSLFVLIHPNDVQHTREAFAQHQSRLICRLRCNSNKYIPVEFTVFPGEFKHLNLVGRVLPEICLACTELKSRIDHACSETRS